MSTIVKSNITGFQMPPLLYPASALAPAISQATIEYHYGIAEAEKEDIFQIRNLLVCAVNKANSPATAKN